MRKRVFVTLIILLSVFGLCACSEKVKEGNDNEGKDSSATNDEIIKEKSDYSSVADPSENVSLEEKRIIQDQSFKVELGDWGNVRFVSYEPDNSIGFEDVSFFLTKEDMVIYSFPYYCENNSTENYVGLFDSVAAVDFCDVNNDNIKDVIVIINYVTGAGPQGMTPRPRARIFLADNQKFNQEFTLATDLIDDITNNMEEKELTIAAICEYLKNKSTITQAVEQVTPKPSEEEKSNDIEITLNIYNMNKEAIYSEKVKTEKTNLLEIMSNIDALKMETEDSEGGKFIVSIMDISYDYGQYWNCYINGESLLENISLYEMKDNDVVDLRYEKTGK
ncbi:hypothetical protein acsn021_29870 [Anaerocolumna cellulosilytica]|uniref:Transcobalamin-like C-terminal domain-containing protein n=1 Tax=Anaerocolumna cellulosilytica TaxID=433286 RepID=A0A6S6R8W9_9FIRM|nr:DUF4430 domain-containing protein [Anaerocolumna cellulosilytica]MBB5198113.1 hypothetical protein [Anaerocolumna cellulosilytica]BCJ95418.1 hypothetical protein acsn021_29870 [Anaerocolumna cellulosilytica]